MDAELTAILNNIKSLADQATQMSGGGAGAEGAEGAEPVEMSQAELPPEVAEKVLKYLKEMDGSSDEDDTNEDDVEKSANGPTASDSSEARIDETAGEENDKNINSVAKAIAKILANGKVGKSVVKKSQSNGVAELTNVVKTLVQEIQVQKEFNTNILKGLGIADSIIASEKETEIAKSTPADVSPQEIAKSLEYIKQALGGVQTVPATEPATNGTGHYIAKSLAEGDGALLMGMFPKTSKK